MDPEFLVIGAVTADRTPQGLRMGGTAAYSALTAARLGLRVALVTHPRLDLPLAPLLEGIQVQWVNPPATIVFENRVTPQGRIQFVQGEASPLTWEDVPLSWRAVPLVHLGPVAAEVAPALAGVFPRALLGVSPQGWMRQWDQAGRVAPRIWEDALLVLPRVDVLILSEEDVARREDMDWYADMVPIMVVTLGSQGAKVHYRGAWHRVPPFPAVERDATGAGDVFAAAYLIHYREHGEPVAAARYANCVASFSVEEEGVGGLPSREQVEARLRSVVPR